jgi:resolvase-like protein
MRTPRLRAFVDRPHDLVAVLSRDERYEYVDRGISGTKDRRPALDQLLADARRRRFDVLVCWRFDRPVDTSADAATEESSRIPAAAPGASAPSDSSGSSHA